MSKILLIEDDREYAQLISDYLSQQHTVELAGTISGALDFLAVYEYELLIVDWHLPDAQGPSLISTLRGKENLVPILMLTGRSALEDKQIGFEAGADDYLTKDAHPRELLMRVQALLRRPAVYVPKTIRVSGRIEMDLAQRTVKRDGQEVHMLPKEFAVLELMARYPKRIFSAEELLERLWPSDTEASSHTVRATINRIRLKLDEPNSSSIIQTKYKAGYQLCEPNSSP